MKAWIVAVAAACIAGAGRLAAQPEPAPDEGPAHDVYLLNGCLEAQPERREAFTLTDAMPGDPAPPSLDGESGDAQSPPTTFHLRSASGLGESGIEESELRAHVGFTVEVTVRPPERAPDPQPSPGVPPAEGAAVPPVAAEAVPPTFLVTAVRRRGGECG